MLFLIRQYSHNTLTYFADLVKIPEAYSVKIFNEFGSSIMEKIFVKKRFTFSGRDIYVKFFVFRQSITRTVKKTFNGNFQGKLRIYVILLRFK